MLRIMLCTALQNLRKFRANFFFFFRRPTLHHQGQNQHTACLCQGTSALGMPVPRHRRAWHARAKAPARLACPCQGTGALGMPVPRHQRAWHAYAKAPARLACPCQGTSALGMPMPRHQCAWRATPRHRTAHAKAPIRARGALAKAPTRAACPCQGTTVWPGWRGHPMGAIRLWGPPDRMTSTSSPPKEVLKHLHDFWEGTHTVLELSPPP
jgi:hypothetical protein